MKYFIFFILIFLVNSNKKIENPLKWQLFHSDTYKATTADVYYKDHIINQKYFIFRIDLNSPYTEIDSKDNCANVNGQFIFNNIIIKMPIFYTYKINENYQNDELNSIIGLSFPKDEIEEKTNFLTNLKKQNIIETKIFSLTSSSEDSKKIDILFGTIPKIEINSNKTHFLVCPMVNKKFECNFKNILIGDNKDFEIKNAKIKFSLDERYVVCPLKFLNFLNDILSQEDKEISDNCKLNLVNEFIYSIICINDSYKKLRDIKIIFEDLSEIIFDPKNLFYERKDKKYQFIMASYKDDKESNNDFVLGYDFFTIFDGVVDLDREILGIYHEKYINNLNGNNSVKYPIEIKNVNLNGFKRYHLLYIIIIYLICLIMFKKYSKKRNIKKDELINEEELEEK